MLVTSMPNVSAAYIPYKQLGPKESVIDDSFIRIGEMDFSYSSGKCAAFAHLFGNNILFKDNLGQNYYVSKKSISHLIKSEVYKHSCSWLDSSIEAVIDSLNGMDYTKLRSHVNHLNPLSNPGF